MPKKKLDAATMLKSANAETAMEIIRAGMQASEETQKEPEQTKEKRPMPKSPGRPKGQKTEGMNIKLTAAHKEYLRQRSFERSTIKQAVTASDIIGELIEADMKKYYKAKK